jgi:hypothetical protein
MARPVEALAYIQLGESFQKLRFPEGAAANRYAENLELVRVLTGDCGFSTALNALNEFDRFRLVLRFDSIEEAESKALAAVANTIGNVLYKEAQERMTIRLDRNEVSRRLRELPRLVQLTDEQMELVNETIRCIECGAYRAAAVMGWNLAYDCIRRSVFANELSALNAGLAKECPRKKPIAQYEDFFDKDAPLERHIIDAMSRPESGPIIGGELHDTLVQYLRLRNKYAHASEKPASAQKTNAYIEHLIDIITARPFR